MTKQETLTPATEVAGVTLIPLNRLKKSPRNVRRVPHTEASIDALAASIAAVGLLQNLVVEPEVSDDGQPTGHFLVIAGEGRRLAQLLRAKRKEIGKAEPMPCRVEATGNAWEISLHENTNREAMHPADEFEAFKTLIDNEGFAVEDVAARFGVTPTVVKQRMKLAAVAPSLVQQYRDGALSLQQLMAFTVTDNHERQESVWAQLGAWNNDAGSIRHRLMQNHARHDDRRVMFVGAEAYEGAGGIIERDLFDLADGGGYFRDVALLDGLAHQKLTTLAAEIQVAEGWKWAEGMLDFPYSNGLRRVHPRTVALNDDDAQALQVANDAYEALCAEHEGMDEFPQSVAEQAEELGAIIERLENLKTAFDPADVARAGLFVTLNHDGQPKVTRGLVRAEDEMPEVQDEADSDADAATATEDDGETGDTQTDDEDTEAALVLSDNLVRDLTAHRTVALRLEIGKRPYLALQALTHTLAAQTFFHFTEVYCLDIRPTCTQAMPAEGLEANPAAAALQERHDEWQARMPDNPAHLWAFIAELDGDSLMDLFAHCTARTLDATKQPHTSRLRGNDVLQAVAEEFGFDMANYWKPTVSSFFGRITRAQIIQSVAEAIGPETAARLDGLKKQPMAEEAERLMQESRWLPAPLRPKPAAKPQITAQDGEDGLPAPFEALAAE